MTNYVLYPSAFADVHVVGDGGITESEAMGLCKYSTLFKKTKKLNTPLTILPDKCKMN